MKTLLIILLINLNFFIFGQRQELNVNNFRVIDKGEIAGEYIVKIYMNKNCSGFAKFEETVPIGYIAKPLQTNGGSFSMQDQEMKIVWVDYSDEKVFSYKLTLKTFNDNKFILNKGLFRYLDRDGAVFIKMPIDTIDVIFKTKNNFGDNDGDGIYNDRDECPDYFGKKGTNGCPDYDNDGIKDSEDKCPNVFGLKNNFGCPLSEKPKDEVKLELNTFKILNTTHSKYVFKYQTNYFDDGTSINESLFKGNLIEYKNNEERVIASNIFVYFEKNDFDYQLKYPIKNGLLYSTNLKSQLKRFEVDTINNVIDTSVYYNKLDIEKIIQSRCLYKKLNNNNWEYVDLYSNKTLNHFGEGKLFFDKTFTNNEFTFAQLSDNSGLKMSVIGISDNKEFLPVLTDKNMFILHFYMMKLTIVIIQIIMIQR